MHKKIDSYKLEFDKSFFVRQMINTVIVVFIMLIFYSCLIDKSKQAALHYKTAMQYYSDFRYAESLEEFEEYLKVSNDIENKNDSTDLPAQHFMAICASRCDSDSYADSLFYGAIEKFVFSNESAEFCSLLIDYGIHLQKTNRYADAQEVFKRSQLLTKQNRFEDLYVYSEILLAKNYRIQNEFKKTELIINSFSNTEQKNWSSKNKVEFLSEKALYYQYLSNFTEAEKLAKEALRIARASGDNNLLALSYYTVVQTRLANRSLKNLINFIDSARYYYREINDLKQLACTDILQIEYFIHCSHYDKAIVLLNRTENYLRHRKDTASLFKLLFLRYSVFSSWKNNDEAIALLEEAESLICYSSEIIIWKGIIHNLSQLYYIRNDSLAHNFLIDALNKTRTLNNYRAEFQCFYSLSWFYVNKKDYKTALIFLDSAEQLLTRKNNIYYISTIYDLRGRIAYSRRNFDKALQLYLKTISNGSLYNSNWVVATNLFNISAIYNRLGNIEFGEKYSEMALEIFKNSENKEFASVILEVNAKFAYTRANAADKKDPDYRANLKKTIEYACRAIRLKEEIRQTSDDESKKKYLDSEFGIYQMMISCYKGLGNKSAEFEAIEISKTKWLEERICKDLQFNQNISLAESQKMATGNTLFISYAKRIESYYYSSVIDESDYFSTKISKRKFVFDSLIFLSGFSSYLHNSLPENKYKKYVDHEYKSKNGKLMKEIYYLFISYYRELIQRSSFTPQQRIDFAMASNALYRFLLGPFEEQLKGKNKLIIIPDGLLGFIPFESLINNDGQYLVEIFDIQYIQSLSVLKLLNERKYEKLEKGLIAFGGAEYSEEKFGRFEDNSVNRSCKQLKGLSNSDIYSKLGFNSFNNIPESCNEIERIADEFSKKKIYSGKKVTESLVKELSENNSLIDYSVIHFSTHGIFIPEYPNLSAIVLPAGDKSEDGFLNAKEIAKLNIQADFVNLSACETGLGKIYEGEGVVGIAQSFVIAGANAMSVSLWQVADRSTSIFMTELYKMVREDNISYSMAMNRIKRKFINGDYHKAQILPYYWAPFIYYGK